MNHVGSFRFGVQSDLPVDYGYIQWVGLALVAQTVDLDCRQIVPGVGQGPGGRAAAGVPVIKLLVTHRQWLACLRVPEPWQQVGLGSLATAVAGRDRSLQDGSAVKGDGALAVGR